MQQRSVRAALSNSLLKHLWSYLAKNHLLKLSSLASLSPALPDVTLNSTIYFK